MEATRRVPTRFERIAQSLSKSVDRQGDALVAKVREMFHNGIGIKWGDDQIRVFNAFLASCLPLIYGNSWQDEKSRVLGEWKLNRHRMYSLVNMARRNGKTFVVSGATAALLLCIPNVKIAIFSTCKRTSQMMLTAIMEMLERAFDKGTHVQRQDFLLVTKNMESVCYEGPDGSKRLLGSFPGSVRVSMCQCVCVCVCGRERKQARFFPGKSDQRRRNEMSDEVWQRCLLRYFGTVLSDDKLVIHINNCPRGNAEYHSFLETCVDLCKCDEAAECVVARCLRFHPPVVVAQYGESLLDVAVMRRVNLHHVKLLYAYGVRLRSLTERCAIFYAGDILDMKPVFTYLIEQGEVSWRWPLFTAKYSNIATPYPLYRIVTCFEARESRCRRCAATILSARFRRATGVLKDLCVLIARSVWATRLQDIWSEVKEK